MANIYESELEGELEQEMHEDELEFEDEGEGFLGGLLGEGEGEDEFESESEDEYEGEFEAGEQFFGSVFRGIKGLVKRAAPFLKRIAKVAAPMVGSAIGGPFGGMLGRFASNALGEGELEFEDEYEFEGEGEYEDEGESESEAVHEIMNHELSSHEALAEMMAASASQAAHEGEAEAMIGASAMTVISPADRRVLRQMLPYLVSGTAVLTRILRRRRSTRIAVRAVPSIVRRTVKTLRKHAAAGKPITRKIVAKAAASQVKKVLSSPKICTAAIARNVKSARAIKRGRRIRAVRG